MYMYMYMCINIHILTRTHAHTHTHTHTHIHTQRDTIPVGLVHQQWKIRIIYRFLKFVHLFFQFLTNIHTQTDTNFSQNVSLFSLYFSQTYTQTDTIPLGLAHQHWMSGEGSTGTKFSQIYFYFLFFTNIHPQTDTDRHHTCWLGASALDERKREYRHQIFHRLFFCFYKHTHTDTHRQTPYLLAWRISTR
jgi:hypothetical protein